MSSIDRKMDESKLLWHMERVQKHFDRGERVAPIHIDWGISKFCNINCVFCFGIFQNPKKEYIKREALLRSVREAGEIGVKSIAFVGDGEPTTNPALYDALKVGKENGVSMAISTSGVALNNEERALTVLETCDWMRFSISAGDREGYLKVHRVDVFDRVVENIKRIVKLKEKTGSRCDIGLQSVFVPGMMNEDMIKEAQLAVDLGVDYFVIKQCSLPVENSSVGDVKFDINEYTSREVVEALKIAENLSTEKTSVIPKWKTIERLGKREYSHCPAVPLISEISGNGDWYPCGYFFGEKPEYDNYRFGNLHDSSLKEIFESERYWNIIKHFRYEFDSQESCKGSCRLDSCNKFIDNYITKPSGINFI